MAVDDNQSFHDLYTAMLEDTDYGTIRTYDGDDAWGKLEEKKPDLIILGILLPSFRAAGEEFHTHCSG